MRASQLYEQLVEVDSLLNDFNRELSDYTQSCQCSEEELYETETRLNEINRLKVKYGNRIEDILAYYGELQEKIKKLEDYENYVAGLKKQCEEEKKKLVRCAKELSVARKEQAQILEKAICKGLQELNFVDVKFEIHFETLQECGTSGIDDVEFMISMNPGQPVRPLVNVASGGELSRIMLAIKTVMADRDEIDVGISGRTAQKVSEKMAVIGKNHQVICITHLAQIAAMADQHYMIEKVVSDQTTKTVIRGLNEKESVDELSRILGGAKITDAVADNAREMKQLAKEIKKI